MQNTEALVFVIAGNNERLQIAKFSSTDRSDLSRSDSTSGVAGHSAYCRRSEHRLARSGDAANVGGGPQRRAGSAGGISETSDRRRSENDGWRCAFFWPCSSTAKRRAAIKRLRFSKQPNQNKRADILGPDPGAVTAGFACPNHICLSIRGVSSGRVRWHPEQESVYWTDVNGGTVERYACKSGERKRWSIPAESLAGTQNVTRSCKGPKQRRLL